MIFLMQPSIIVKCREEELSEMVALFFANAIKPVLFSNIKKKERKTKISPNFPQELSLSFTWLRFLYIIFYIT